MANDDARRYPHYPVWFVVTSREARMELNQFGLRHILRVDAGDMADMGSYYDRVVAPLFADNPMVEYQMYAREPDNLFRTTSEADASKRSGGDA